MVFTKDVIVHDPEAQTPRDSRRPGEASPDPDLSLHSSLRQGVRVLPPVPQRVFLSGEAWGHQTTAAQGGAVVTALPYNIKVVYAYIV